MWGPLNRGQGFSKTHEFIALSPFLLYHSFQLTEALKLLKFKMHKLISHLIIPPFQAGHFLLMHSHALPGPSVDSFCQLSTWHWCILVFNDTYLDFNMTPSFLIFPQYLAFSLSCTPFLLQSTFIIQKCIFIFIFSQILDLSKKEVLCNFEEQDWYGKLLTLNDIVGLQYRKLLVRIILI